MHEIKIEVDINDGDYVETTNPISEDKLERFRPLIKELAETKNYNFGDGDAAEQDYLEQWSHKFDESLLEDFRSYCPCPEHGFHSITNIIVYPEPEKEVLL